LTTSTFDLSDHPVPMYAEAKPEVPTDVQLDMQENIAYGPTNHPIGKLEMRDNIAYGSVGH